MADSMEAPEPLVFRHNSPSAAPDSTIDHQLKDTAGVPLCVDLDGTLVKTDTLIEGVLAILSRHSSIELGGLLTLNRAAFKRQVSNLANISPELLPYNKALIAYLEDVRRSNRPIILVTGADETVAWAIAKHIGIFDDVIASDGKRNLNGGAKARELVHRYGRKGFDYAGNDRADLAVWREAKGIIIVNASTALTEEASAFGTIIAEFQSRPPRLATALRAIRPHQWVKNLLVFVPLLTSRSFSDWPGILGALLLFASFCATASGIYLINDLLDIRADRAHPRKRRRPFASGDLSLAFGAGLSILLLVMGLGLAVAAGTVRFVVLYTVISLSYSLWLKHFPLVDVFTLAALYTLRIVAGGVASQHPATLWLEAFSGFTFLSLALVKRCAELPTAPLHDGSLQVVRGYFAADRTLLVMFGTASAFASSVVLALFVGSTAAAQEYQSPEMLWGLVPLILFWQCRLWLSTERGKMHDDPIVFSSKDWVSWIVAAIAVALLPLAAWSRSAW